jgi:hypothetical protein
MSIKYAEEGIEALGEALKKASDARLQQEKDLPKSEKEVTKELKVLDECVGRAADYVDSITEKLSTVVNRDKKKELSTESAVADGILCPLAEGIRHDRYRIEAIISALDDLLQNIEL